MDITLRPELKQRIAEKVRAGGFKSADQVVELALDALDWQGEFQGAELERVRAMVQEGVEQADRGEATPWDGKAMQDELQKEYAQRQRRPA